MKTLNITTEMYDQDFDHGTVKVIKTDGIEKKIKIEIELVISEDAENLRDEIQEVIQRYAI